MAENAEVKKWLNEHQKSDLDNFNAIHTHLDRLDKATNNDLVIYKIDELQREVKEMREQMGTTYVTKVEFDPIKKVVYGVVGVMLLSIIGAIVAMVLKK